MNTVDERFVCRNTARLERLKDSTFPGTPNAIDYVEVRDHDEPTKALRQRTLFLHLIRLMPSGTVLGPNNIVITGGDRITTVPVTWVQPADSATPPAGVALADWQALVADLDEPDLVLVIRTDVRGDFSTYLLSLVTPGSTVPPPGFDEELSTIALRFKVECPTDFDCLDAVVCEPDPPVKPPSIDYLAKDFTGFRRIILERLAQLSPAWAERNVGDIGIALVELLAYTADELSWRQDAIATEAYLGTARSRRSLRRHARLVDSRIHEGASARLFARIDTAAPTVVLPAHTRLLTAVPDQSAAISTANAAVQADLIRRSATIFETTADATLHGDCKEIGFYTWGDPTTCLERGATSATLTGQPTLSPGDILILAETVSPTTGKPQDADPQHRYAVRLVTVTPDQDTAGGLFETPPSMTPVPVTRITWHADDALARSLPVVDADGNPLAMAWGNIVLADQGETIPGETFDLTTPVLHNHDLAFVVDPPATTVAASAAVTAIDPRGATPAVNLIETDLTGATNPWVPQPDLLESEPAHRHFVVEVDTDRSAWLRFGDGHLGMATPTTSTYTATYRIGGGARGNIGAETLRHIVTDLPAITGARNPMPAQGGSDPETPDQIRRDAPQAFLVQERAVTPDDYSAMAVRSGTVLHAATTFRWTGSWNTVFVTADRPGAQKVDHSFVTTLRDWLEPYRMAGYDLEIDAPVVVPLQIDVFICAGPGHLRSDIAAAAYDVLSSHRNADGTTGLFQPDRWTFGQSVYLSSIYAAVQAIEGVSSVEVQTFQRLDQPLTSGLATGVLPMQRLEIPRLDNDPDFPERGQLTVTVGGGR
ncbi:MAG: putative baseplate assembly protein [Marmoricola sp.]